MTVTVNNDMLEIGEGRTIADLLQSVPAGQEARGIAVAVNNEVVPGREWQEYRLCNGDKVLIIRAVQGG